MAKVITGRVHTRSIIDDKGRRAEAYEIRVLVDGAKTNRFRSLLLSPAAFLEATRRHQLHIKGDPKAQYPKPPIPA